MILDNRVELERLKLMERFYARKRLEGSHKTQYEFMLGKAQESVREVGELVKFLEEVKKDAV